MPSIRRPGRPEFTPQLYPKPLNDLGWILLLWAQFPLVECEDGNMDPEGHAGQLKNQ